MAVLLIRGPTHNRMLIPKFALLDFRVWRCLYSELHRPTDKSDLSLRDSTEIWLFDVPAQYLEEEAFK